jgi:segregation and condensation protein B
MAPPHTGRGIRNAGPVRAHPARPGFSRIHRVSDHLKPIVEALIFASPEPVTRKTLYKLLEGESKEDVDAALAAVRGDYEAPRGLQLVEVAGGYQITTRPELHEWVRKLFHDRTTQKLSVQSLETLAVIAYKQPVTAAEIAEIRGVTSSGGVLSTLVERRLIKTVGRKQVVGRPFMYATTREFLERFGLSDLSDLPKVEELSDALGFELPTALSEPSATTTSLPFDADTSGEDGGVEASEARQTSTGESEAPVGPSEPSAAGNPAHLEEDQPQLDGEQAHLEEETAGEKVH